MVDSEDPNTWTAQYVTLHRKECLTLIWETNQITIRCLREGSYAPAIVGLDRILNGLITMHNCKRENYRSFLFSFSMLESIVLMALIPSNPDKASSITSSAIATLEDAMDFARTIRAKRNIKDTIRQIRAGWIVNSQDISGTIELLEDLGRRIASIM